MDNSYIGLIRRFLDFARVDIDTGADARPQAGGFIRDVRRQARNRYRPATLCRATPCCHGGQFTLTHPQGDPSH